jgi:hypothetical protein
LYVNTTSKTQNSRNVLIIKNLLWNINYGYIHTRNSVAWVRERIIPTKRQPFVGEISGANFFVNREFRMVSTTDLYGRILDFLDRSHYFFFQVAPQLYSLGCVDSVPDLLLLRKSGSAGNWTRTSGSLARNYDQ